VRAKRAVLRRSRSRRAFGKLGGDGETGEKAPLGCEVEVGFGVEKLGETPSEVGGVGDKFGGGVEWDAWPSSPQSIAVSAYDMFPSLIGYSLSYPYC
jgi:hypothetical protein